MCGDQQKMIPVVVVERLWPVLGLGLLKAAPSRTCEAGSVWKLPLRLHFTTGILRSGGVWELESCGVFLGGLLLYLPACHLVRRSVSWELKSHFGRCVDQLFDWELQLPCGPAFWGASLCVHLLWAGTRKMFRKTLVGEWREMSSKDLDYYGCRRCHWLYMLLQVLGENCIYFSKF